MMRSTVVIPIIFLSTLSLRRATKNPMISVNEIAFLSTLSLRRATSPASVTPATSRNFYPRSPCGERRRHSGDDGRPVHFYPRSPCGERPIGDIKTPHFTSYFYPRSPCGERPCRAKLVETDTGISIHALLAESDVRPKRLKSRRCVFLSTLSLRRATNCQHRSHQE